MTSSPSSWRKDGACRPSVLVADDNAAVLAKVSALLGERFDLVAAVTDGRQAVNAARQLDPEVVVLDVTMPELDGFQTARELRRSGSRAKMVMLTMHQSDEFVAAALEAGVEGYVLKTRLLSDLEAAIEHVIAGRLFVPSLTSLLAIAPAPGAGGHAVQFVSHDRACLNGVSDLLAAALRRGDVVAVVATDATIAGIEQRLVASGGDTAQAADRGRYISVNAGFAASQVMVGGRFDASRLATIVDDLERSRLAASASCLTIVGEIAPQLCRDGHSKAAIQVEHAWDELTRPLPFLTVCFYPMECFSEMGAPELFPAICAPHSAVCHANA